MRHDGCPDRWPESDASITVASQSRISDDAVYACTSRHAMVEILELAGRFYMPGVVAPMQKSTAIRRVDLSTRKVRYVR